MTPCCLCISDIAFLPRDAMQARPMPSCGVCLSVRPSVTFVNSVKTSNRIFKISSPSGSQTILVFSYQTSWQIFRWRPLKRGRRMEEGYKKHDFWPVSRFISASFSMTLKDPYPRFQGHAILWRWISQKRYEIHRHSFNGILIGTYTHPTQLQCHFECHTGYVY